MLITIIIAASLPQLKLQPGTPLPKGQDMQEVYAPAPDVQEDLFVVGPINMLRVVIVCLILAGVALYAIYRLLRGTDRETVSYTLRFMLIFIVIISGFAYLTMLLPNSSSSTSMEFPLLPQVPVEPVPLGSLPQSLLWLVGIGLLVISVLVGVWILTFSRRARPMSLYTL